MRSINWLKANNYTILLASPLVFIEMKKKRRIYIINKLIKINQFKCSGKRQKGKDFALLNDLCTRKSLQLSNHLWKKQSSWPEINQGAYSWRSCSSERWGFTRDSHRHPKSEFSCEFRNYWLSSIYWNYWIVCQCRIRLNCKCIGSPMDFFQNSLLNCCNFSKIKIVFKSLLNVSELSSKILQIIVTLSGDCWSLFLSNMFRRLSSIQRTCNGENIEMR